VVPIVGIPVGFFKEYKREKEKGISKGKEMS